MNRTNKPFNSGKSKHSIRNSRTTQCFSYSLLESRQMLTTFIVDSIGDDVSGVSDGAITLREALVAAETNTAFGDALAGDTDGDVIQFDSSTLGQTIVLTEGEFSITDDVAIQGGSNNITIDANLLSRIFNINSTEEIVIRDINLTNGSVSDAGGAILIAGTGTTTFNNLTISTSTAMGDGGGAIASSENMVSVLNSELSLNEATGASGSGGAVLVNSGDFRIVNSTLSGNIANRAGGAIEIVDGLLTVVDTTLGGVLDAESNTAGPAGTASPGNGGAIHVTGSSGTEVSIIGSNIQNNLAASEGGGLWNQAGSLMFVRNSQIVDNVAMGDAADDGGGGVFNNGGTTRLRDSAITGNQATGASGSGGGTFSTAGLLSIIDTTLASNVANRAGGAIEIIDGDLFVLRSTIGGEEEADGNIAGPAGSENPGNGGGLHVSGTDGTSSVIRQSTVQNNVAAREGGGLWNQAGSTLRVLESDVLDNTASGDAADDGGGGIFNNGGTARVRESLISGNVADGVAGSGGGIFSTDGLLTVRNSTVSSNAANRAGGGIEVVDGTARLRDTTLGGESVDDGNVAGPGISASPGNGGGLHVTGNSGTQTFIDGGSVENNFAASEGGGLWNQAGSSLTVRNGTSITNNIAAGNDADNGGGGIFNNGGSVGILDSLVADNQATGTSGSGGGLLTTDGLVTILDSIFSDNVAVRAGGGIEIIDGSLLVTDSILSQNVAGPDGSAAPGNGGALHVTGNSGTFTSFDSTIISGNVAANEGGGLWNQTGSTMVVRNGSSVISNIAGAGGGGGIFNNGGIVNVLGSTLSNNSTDGDGGGINSIALSVLQIDNSTISQNAADEGGGIFNVGSAFVTQTVVSFNTAVTGGGGIFTDSTGTTTLTDSILFGNTPDDEN